MKKLLAVALLFLTFGFSPSGGQENIEFVCMKTHKASNTCYFNFLVDGVKYTYTDKGCKRTKDKEDTINRVKDGKLSLAKDWKIACPEKKEPAKDGSEGL
jgi:hypothetical protein